MIKIDQLSEIVWCKTSTGRFARFLSVDTLLNRVDASIHDAIYSAQNNFDESNLINVPYSTVKMWEIIFSKK
jgi:hypothetical protein